MKKSTRIILYMISAGLLIMIIIIFRDFLFERIIKPIADRLDILYRYAVLSLDQYIVWSIMIISASLILFFLLILKRENLPQGPVEPVIENFYSRRFKMWESYLNNSSPYSKSRLKKELTKILACKYAIQKRLDVDYVLIDAFKNREIPLPEHIQSFLFMEEKKSSFGIKNLIYSWSGRKAGDYNKSLQECILFLEKFMELKDE